MPNQPTDDGGIDREHPVFDRFRVAGYDPEKLVDPGRVDPSDVRGGGWQVVKADGHGVERFDVGAGDVAEYGRDVEGIDHAVEFTDVARQPIGYADERGALYADNDLLDDLGRGGVNASVVFFYPPDAPQAVPDLSPAEAVAALGYWGSEGFMPRRTAEAVVAAFGGETGGTYRDDPDVEGGEITRSTHVVTSAVSAAGGDVKSADSGITGHKKTRMQKFSRNMDVLRGVVDGE